MKRALCGFALLVSVSLPAQVDVKKELEKFQGTWALTSAAGQPLPAGSHAGLVFTGDKYQGSTNGTIDERGTIKLDLTTKPISIDLVITEGQSAGKTQLGLVEVADDTMTLILTEPGSPVRPSTSSPDKLTLTRVKPLAKDFEGSWEGTIDAGGKALRLVVKLSNGPDGLATGTLVSVDQGGREAPIVAVVQAGSHLRFVLPAIRGTYEGDLKDKQVTGTWTQGQGSVPLVFKRPM